MTGDSSSTCSRRVLSQDLNSPSTPPPPPPPPPPPRGESLQDDVVRSVQTAKSESLPFNSDFGALANGHFNSLEKRQPGKVCPAVICRTIFRDNIQPVA
ncbi:hypothetical protein WN51_08659 [Melipona quadrifasciata]|uniref:Uncharacterized protein n=1 Tax=Melipona quadrifasciata TaxID=166423 RepID=A0A0M9A7M7_9HYME|nr:hypothetical protein WN51_08659 [Melipona quadrifasciata]